MTDQSTIRNFAIIAHIDHGKSTLSDRLLELTGTVAARDMQEQLLDSNPIERERGVTIKLAPVTMSCKLEGEFYQLNLIDTPGHVDFSYEVERSLAACEGAVLLIDATQGIQAQTLAHAQKAVDLGLTIIPAINKVDLPNARTIAVLSELQDMFGFRPPEVSLLSAKTGQGVPELIFRIINEVPAPSGETDATLRALIFNSTFDQHLGVIAFIRVTDGTIKPNQKLSLLSTHQAFLAKEVGIFTPGRMRIDALSAGQVGYLATGLKDIHDVHVGDTVSTSNARSPEGEAIVPLPGYREPKPTVYADVYPAEGIDYQQFLEAVDRLRLADASLTAKPIFSPALGPGLRLGFLGLFHVEIAKERLEREYGIPTIFTNPTVEYIVHKTNGEVLSIQNPNDLPDPSAVSHILEPMTRVSLFSPAAYLGPLMQVLENRRGLYQTTVYLGARAQLLYDIPLAELVNGLFDEIKSASSGYATLDYDHREPRAVNAVKLSILVNHEPVEALARIVVRDRAVKIARQMVDKMKELLPPQQFAVPIQAAIGSQIIARQTQKALRKDVTAKLYGGDQTRKDKLLKKQKKGKKKMARIGKIAIPDDVLTKIAQATR